MPGEQEIVGLCLLLFTSLSLATACGLSLFAPYVLLSLAVTTGKLETASLAGWIDSSGMLIGLALACLCEAVSRSVLQLPATPRLERVASALAGGLLAVLVLLDRLPVWGLILVALAGALFALAVRGLLRASRRSLRTKPLAALGEILAAALVSGVAIFAPVTAPVLVIALLAAAVQNHRRDPRAAAH
jgi:hypothetical protein